MLKLIANFGLSTQTGHAAITSVPSVGEFNRVGSSQDQGRVDHMVRGGGVIDL